MNISEYTRRMPRLSTLLLPLNYLTVLYFFTISLQMCLRNVIINYLCMSAVIQNCSTQRYEIKSYAMRRK